MKKYLAYAFIFAGLVMIGWFYWTLLLALFCMVYGGYLYSQTPEYFKWKSRNRNGN